MYAMPCEMSRLMEIIFSRGRDLWSSLCKNDLKEPPERNSVMTQNTGGLLHAPTSYTKKKQILTELEFLLFMIEEKESK
jgi:hypothetical protein